MLAGAAVATRRQLTARTTALIQHAAAGAGLVVDVLAKLLARPDQLAYAG